MVAGVTRTGCQPVGISTQRAAGGRYALALDGVRRRIALSGAPAVPERVLQAGSRESGRKNHAGCNGSLLVERHAQARPSLAEGYLLPLHRTKLLTWKLQKRRTCRLPAPGVSMFVVRKQPLIESLRARFRQIETRDQSGQICRVNPVWPGGAAFRNLTQLQFPAIRRSPPL